jgi:hypothetical protein
MDTMADKYFELALTPAVQLAQDKYFGKGQAVARPLGKTPAPDGADSISRLKVRPRWCLQGQGTSGAGR